MNSRLRLQISAAAVTLNGIAALVLIGSTPALATSCGEVIQCIGYVNCESQTQAWRNAGCANAAPGCTVKSAFCLNSGLPLCAPTQGGLVCIYN
jgi:hypothetical protein